MPKYFVTKTIKCSEKKLSCLNSAKNRIFLAEFKKDNFFELTKGKLIMYFNIIPIDIPYFKRI